MVARTEPGSGSGPEREDPRVAALARVVRARRAGLGLRQTELADLAGCLARFVHTVEHSRSSLRLDKVLDVLEVLGLDLLMGPGEGRVAVVAAARGMIERPVRYEHRRKVDKSLAPEGNGTQWMNPVVLSGPINPIRDADGGLRSRLRRAAAPSAARPVRSGG